MTRNVATTEATPWMERRQEDHKDLAAQLLPDDALADVLSRLEPRGLAVSRCVCRAWHALIDGHCLLRKDLLPRSLAGLFIKYSDLLLADIFAPPPPPPHSADQFTGCRLSHILDHCNGLVLQYDSVLNPATGQWAPLPGYPPPPCSGMDHYYLVFDPTVSMHYEVFLIPRVPSKEEESDDDDEVAPTVFPNSKTCEAEHIDGATLEPELWPPSPFILNVFSSATGRWEKRSFDRQGEAAGTIANMQLVPQWVQHHHAVYWQGALYVHSDSDFVTRISLSNNTYRVIKPPQGIEMCKYPQLHLGKSEKGVYCALLDDNHLRVWTLGGSCDQNEWILNNYISCRPVLPSLNCVQEVHDPWISHKYNSCKSDDNEALEEYNFQWDSDEGNILHTGDKIIEGSCGKYVEILGFHLHLAGSA
ncbi:hypothetical protein C2845_PM01G34640 [Panicum miliaceum]|uniref:F-box domain-containing protein n=1 Tax=Panicum miliaceum TaxID=4540 RepID=A0A3L6THP6_PANMI|nr:hypothetical protein C2845_PM01G34640 [Panicum miliaceum]